MINPRPWQISADPVEELKFEIKDISKFKPLFLNKKPSSWLYDSKNLLRIYLRCKSANFLPEQLCLLLNKWASILLETLPYYVRHEENPKNNFGFLDLSWFASVLWVRDALRDVANAKPEDIYNSKIKTFYRCDINVNKRCGILHSHCKVVYRYTFMLEDGSTAISDYLEAYTYQSVVRKIKRSIKRVSNAQYKKKLLKEIEEYNGNRKPSGRLAGRSSL